MAGLHCKDAPPLIVCNLDVGLMDSDLFLMHDWERSQCCGVPVNQESLCLSLTKSLLHFAKRYVLGSISATCVRDRRASLALGAGENESGGAVLGAGGARGCGRAGREPAGFMAAMERQMSSPAAQGDKKPRVAGLFQRTVSSSRHLSFSSNLSLSFHFCPRQCLDSPNPNQKSLTKKASRFH